MSFLPDDFCDDGDKATDILLNSTFNGNNNRFLRCGYDFKKPGVQE